MLVKVFTAEHIAGAGLLRGYLDQHNIPSQLRNEYCSSVMGELPFMTSSPEIWVDSSLAQAAQKLMAELKQPTAGGSQWSCLRCEELNPENFSICWNCQAAQT